jgi:hypothetical protein
MRHEDCQIAGNTLLHCLLLFGDNPLLRVLVWAFVCFVTVVVLECFYFVEDLVVVIACLHC